MIGMQLWLASSVGKLVAGLLLVLALIGGGAWYYHHVYHSGELAQKVRDDTAAKIESDRADAARAALNQRIAAVQADLAKSRERVAELQKDFDNEKAVSDARQRDLLAGRERMRVLVRAARPAGADGPAQGGSAAGVDSGGEVVVDIDPAVASNLERFRSERNRAAVALDACIVDYDALKAAVDALP